MSVELRRNRRTRVVILVAVVATFLAFPAVAWALGETNTQTTVSPKAAEPGQAISVGASGSTLQVGSAYELAWYFDSARCHSSGKPFGPTANAMSSGIPSMNRTLPFNITSGTRYLCWRLAEDRLVSNTIPVAILIF